MGYPVEILPRTGLEYITNFLDETLIRHTPEKEIWATDDLIKEDMICSPKSGMPDLSSSLLGVFNFDHIFIKIKNAEFNKYCTPNFDAEVPLVSQDYELVQSRGFFLIRIQSINGILVDFTKDGNENYAQCQVRHTPMKWNYYHFSINWFFLKENKFWHELPDNDKNKDWSKKRLSSRTRSELKMKISKELHNQLYSHSKNRK